MSEYTPGYIIGQCKRKWRDSHKITTYNDELSKEEAALFTEDSVLLELFQEMKKTEQAIIDHIDKVLKLHREGAG